MAVHVQHISLSDPASQPDPGSVHTMLAAVLLNAPRGTPGALCRKAGVRPQGPPQPGLQGCLPGRGLGRHL